MLTKTLLPLWHSQFVFDKEWMQHLKNMGFYRCNK